MKTTLVFALLALPMVFADLDDLDAAFIKKVEELLKKEKFEEADVNEATKNILRLTLATYEQTLPVKDQIDKLADSVDVLTNQTSQCVKSPSDLNLHDIYFAITRGVGDVLANVLKEVKQCTNSTGHGYAVSPKRDQQSSDSAVLDISKYIITPIELVNEPIQHSHPVRNNGNTQNQYPTAFYTRK